MNTEVLLDLRLLEDAALGCCLFYGSSMFVWGGSYQAQHTVAKGMLYYIMQEVRC